MAPASRAVWGGAAVFVAILGAVLPAAHCAEEETAPEKPAITVGQETTRITEPLDERGRVDYIAAFNQRMSEGVTPENNAAVLYWRAFGPGEIDEGSRATFFARLGIAPLPDEGDYLIPLEEYLARLEGDELPSLERLYNELDQAIREPWSAMEQRRLADWVAVNAKPLNLIVEGSARPRYYSPRIGDSMIGILLPDIAQVRNAARLLTARAMLRTREGRHEEAWSDLAAVLRLGEHSAAGGTIVELLVGIAVQALANQGIAALIQQPGLPEPLLARVAEQLAARPPLPRFVEILDRSERHMYLDAVQRIADGTMAADELGGEGIESLLPRVRSYIDWNETMKQGNELYDRLIEILKMEDPAAAAEAEEAFFEEIRKAAEPPGFLELAAIALDPNRAKRIGRRIGGVFNALLLPALGAVKKAENRGIAARELLNLAALLELRRRKDGDYPKSLAALQAAEPAAKRKHAYTGKEYGYRPTEHGYTLWHNPNNDSPEPGDSGQRLELTSDHAVILRRNE